MLSLIRWFARPRLNFIDGLNMAICVGLYPAFGWWVLALLFVGALLSSAIEVTVRP